jgi:hypothetical protein
LGSYRFVRNRQTARWYSIRGGNQMKKITIVQRRENDRGEFIELTHNNADEGRVYRVEIKIQANHWSEWFTTTDSEFNEKWANIYYETYRSNLVDYEVMA